MSGCVVKFIPPAIEESHLDVDEPLVWILEELLKNGVDYVLHFGILYVVPGYTGKVIVMLKTAV